MNLAMLYGLSGVALFCVGLYGLFLHAHLVRKILALNIMSSGVSLFMVALAHRHPHATPDPVPHAMVLTGIVVAVSATALALYMARQLYAATGQTHLAERLPPPSQPSLAPLRGRSALRASPSRAEDRNGPNREIIC